MNTTRRLNTKKRRLTKKKCSNLKTIKVEISLFFRIDKKERLFNLVWTNFTAVLFLFSFLFQRGSNQLNTYQIMQSSSHRDLLAYSYTAISQTPSFSEEGYSQITQLMDKLPLKLISFENLSPQKAVDFKVTVDLTKIATLECTKSLNLSTTSSGKPSESDIGSIESVIRSTIKSNPIPNIDIIFQLDNVDRKAKKLIVFDMDSTLIYQEVIELIAAQADVEAEVERITTLAMNGELDFKQSLAQRVMLLKGIESADLWNQLIPQLRITKGAIELCKVMKSLDCKLAVCSGGFLPLANYIKEQLSLDYAFANQLKTEVNESGVEVLAGETFGDVVDGFRKRDLLEQLAAENGVDMKRAVAIGDGANDLPMMRKAGFGVAWNAKPKVQLEAPACLNSDSLKDVLYIFGFNDLEIQAALEA